MKKRNSKPKQNNVKKLLVYLKKIVNGNTN
jgi:hypothetical protein